jgi:hypothetical protein
LLCAPSAAIKRSQSIKCSDLFCEETVTERPRSSSSLTPKHCDCHRILIPRFSASSIIIPLKLALRIRNRATGGPHMVLQGQQSTHSSSYPRIQHNVHANRSFRMKTNIWDLEELETLSPLRAELIRGLRHGSKLQTFAHAAWGSGWRNIVSMLRVSVYGQV